MTQAILFKQVDLLLEKAHTSVSDATSHKSQAHLPIIPSCSEVLAIGGVSDAGHLVEVALLLEGLLLTLPLPHQQLAQLRTAQSHQVTQAVEGY